MTLFPSQTGIEPEISAVLLDYLGAVKEESDVTADKNTSIDVSPSFVHTTDASKGPETENTTQSSDGESINKRSCLDFSVIV